MKIKHNLKSGVIPKWKVCYCASYGLCDFECGASVGATRGFTFSCGMARAFKYHLISREEEIMKTVKNKILLITWVAITLFAIGYTTTRFAAEAEQAVPKGGEKTVCINGNLFVIASNYRGAGITQMYGGREAHLPPQPKKCKK